MPVSRTVGYYMLKGDREVETKITFAEIIPGKSNTFYWKLPRASLSGSGQSLFDAIRSFLIGYVTSEEQPEGYAGHGPSPNVIITVDSAGDAPTGASGPGTSVHINVLAGGGPCELWVDSAWTKALAAFTSTQQTQVNQFVDAMHAHLQATWPLPPWPA